MGLVGLSGNTVTVEVDISDGLPHYNLLGLPDAALNESRDRVRAALTNSNENWPNRKVTVSLSPAWLPKSGSSFDLAIALAILVAHGALAQNSIDSTLILGELGLDGSIRGVNGVLPALIAGHRDGIARAIIPIANIGEGGLLQAMEIVAFSTLRELLIYLRTGEGMSHTSEAIDEGTDPLLDFEDVAGQMRARFGAEVAAAGGHHLLLIGLRITAQQELQWLEEVHMLFALVLAHLPTMEFSLSMKRPSAHLESSTHFANRLNLGPSRLHEVSETLRIPHDSS